MGCNTTRRAVAMAAYAVLLLVIGNTLPAVADTSTAEAATTTTLAVVPSWLQSQTVNRTTIDVQWYHEQPDGIGGNVRWEILSARGDGLPERNPAAKRFVVAVQGARDYDEGDAMEFRLRMSGLVPDALYVVAIRGVAADGTTSRWRHSGEATHVSGVYLSTGPGGAAGREVRLPEDRDHPRQTLAVEPNGTSHIGIDEGPVVFQSSDTAAMYGVVPAGGAWRGGVLPTAIGSTTYPLTFATSRTKSGVVAVTDGACVWLRSGASGWKEVSCLDSADGEDDYFPSGFTEVSGLQVDRHDKVHAVWVAIGAGGADSFRYGTNASGKWKTSDVSPVSGAGVAHLAYDPATDRVVLATGDWYAKRTRYQLRITSKSATATAFDPFVVRSNTATTRAIVPTSIASYGGQITVAASRSSTGTPYEGEWGTPVLLSGKTPATVGAMTAIPGALADEVADMLVVAVSKNRVVVAVGNEKFGPAQGIWTTTREYAGNVGTWSKSIRRTPSAYDRLSAMSVDPAGQAYILFWRG